MVLITARKCEGYVFTRVCLSTGGWYSSMHCSRSPGRGISRPTPRGEVEGSGQRGLQAHTQGGLQVHTWGSPGPHPGGSPGPHPLGLQAHTQGGVSQHALRQTQSDGYCHGQYASYWNAFLLSIIFL